MILLKCWVKFSFSSRIIPRNVVELSLGICWLYNLSVMLSNIFLLLLKIMYPHLEEFLRLHRLSMIKDFYFFLKIEIIWTKWIQNKQSSFRSFFSVYFLFKLKSNQSFASLKYTKRESIQYISNQIKITQIAHVKRRHVPKKSI